MGFSGRSGSVTWRVNWGFVFLFWEGEVGRVFLAVGFEMDGCDGVLLWSEDQ